jgi:hypothetical protein
LSDYRNHCCKYSKLNCVEVTNNEWNRSTVAEHIAKYNQNYFSYPGKHARIVNDRSFVDIAAEIFAYNDTYFKLPAGTARHLELGHLENSMDLF